MTQLHKTYSRIRWLDIHAGHKTLVIIMMCLIAVLAEISSVALSGPVSFSEALMAIFMTVDEVFHLLVWHIIELNARFQVMILPLGFAFTGRTSKCFFPGLTTVTSITYVFEIRFAFGAIPSVVTIVVPVEARLITSFVVIPQLICATF